MDPSGAPMAWLLQRSKRKRGWYYQGVYRSGGKVIRTAGLGTLSDAEAEWALANLRFFGSGLLPLTNREIKQTALQDPEDGKGALDALVSSDVQERMAAGALADLALKDFVKHVWRPVREAEVAAGTVKREWELAWPTILASLGHVQMTRLNTALWTCSLGQPRLLG